MNFHSPLLKVSYYGYFQTFIFNSGLQQSVSGLVLLPFVTKLCFLV